MRHSPAMRTLAAVACLLSFFLAPEARAQARASERGLIVLLNMYTGDRGFFHDQWYKAETSHALKMILRKTKNFYGETEVLYRDQAKLSKLVTAIRKLDSNPAIRAIDVIVYTHGNPSGLMLIDETVGTIHPLAHWVSVQDIGAQVKALGSRKLRALFADSCFSASHTGEWLRAGFKVASGSIKVDANQDRDLRRFLLRWRDGESFARGVESANREKSAALFDHLVKDGNSRKAYEGDGAITIDSPVY